MTSIVTGGIHRSGTTWLYNTLRMCYPHWSHKFWDGAAENEVIYKSHSWENTFHQFWSILIVRDLRDVAGSLLAFKPTRDYYKITEENVIDVINGMIGPECEHWQPDLILRYEDGKHRNIEQILRFTNQTYLDPQEIYNKVESIRLPDKGRDTLTELWPDHITDGKVSNQTADKIKDHFDWWYRKYYHYDQVLVTGGFDPIHSGHIAYLNAAKELGNKLVVGLNSDDWLRRKKGRPFMELEERKCIISNLSMVDRVIEFNDSDDTANDAIYQLISESNERICFANGGDVTKENCKEYKAYNKNDYVHFEFGIGGKEKRNSSSWILDNYFKINQN